MIILLVLPRCVLTDFVTANLVLLLYYLACLPRFEQIGRSSGDPLLSSLPLPQARTPLTPLTHSLTQSLAHSLTRSLTQAVTRMTTYEFEEFIVSEPSTMQTLNSQLSSPMLTCYICDELRCSTLSLHPLLVIKFSLCSTHFFSGHLYVPPSLARVSSSTHLFLLPRLHPPLPHPLRPLPLSPLLISSLSPFSISPLWLQLLRFSLLRNTEPGSP